MVDTLKKNSMNITQSTMGNNMLYISIALVICGFLAFTYFNRKLYDQKEQWKAEHPAHIPLDEKIIADVKLLNDRINTIEVTMGMTVRRG